MKRINSIEDLEVGKYYTNNELSAAFSCSNMGGMRRSKATNSLLLFALHNNFLYEDYWDGDEFLYTGMGQTGDQSLTYMQNKTLAEHKNNGVKIYLVESYVENKYYYYGEVQLSREPYFDIELDAEHKPRKVVKFPLKRKDSSVKIIVDKEDLVKNSIAKEKLLQKSNISNIAKFIDGPVIKKEVITTHIERNPLVAEYTKNRANGICDLCEQEAPFLDRKGNPYLESHHVITLSDNGPDAIYNTVAVCPNCHKKIHILEDKKGFEKLQKVILEYLLADDDLINKEKHSKLFEMDN